MLNIKDVHFKFLLLEHCVEMCNDKCFTVDFLNNSIARFLYLPGECPTEICVTQNHMAGWCVYFVFFLAGPEEYHKNIPLPSAWHIERSELRLLFGAHLY